MLIKLSLLSIWINISISGSFSHSSAYSGTGPRRNSYSRTSPSPVRRTSGRTMTPIGNYKNLHVAIELSRIIISFLREYHKNIVWFLFIRNISLLNRTKIVQPFIASIIIWRWYKWKLSRWPNDSIMLCTNELFGHDVIICAWWSK